jgi:hypothetical protein
MRFQVHYQRHRKGKMTRKFLRMGVVSTVAVAALLTGGLVAEANAAPAAPSASTSAVQAPASPQIWATYGWYSSLDTCEFVGQGKVNDGTARAYNCTNEGVSGANPWRLDLDYI